MSDPLSAAVASPASSLDPGDKAAAADAIGHTAGEPPVPDKERVGSLASDAWRTLRHSPLFLVSAGLILLFVVMAAFPRLFTSITPDANNLSLSRQPPSAAAWFGYDVQGRSVFARTIYGARASIIVGTVSTFGTVLVGSLMGILAGYYGRWLDSILSRFADVFFGLPFVLGAIVILTTFNTPGSNTSPFVIMLLVISTLVALTWPTSMRIMRSAVISAKQADYVVAARALGAGAPRIIFRHLLPNTLAPVLVYATITVGAFIGAEATLSFLGIGLTPPVVSWGVAISEARNYIRVSPHLLVFPAAFLTTTVLAFVLLGEAVREALDPKLR
jgi:oligopeptide transport system permease protein